MTYLHTDISFCFTWNNVGYVVFTVKTAVFPDFTEANFHSAHYKNTIYYNNTSLATTQDAIV